MTARNMVGNGGTRLPRGGRDGACLQASELGDTLHIQSLDMHQRNIDTHGPARHEVHVMSLFWWRQHTYKQTNKQRVRSTSSMTSMHGVIGARKAQAPALATSNGTTGSSRTCTGQ